MSNRIISLRKLTRATLIPIIIFLLVIIMLIGIVIILSPGKPYQITKNISNMPGAAISQKLFLTINGVKQGMFICGSDTTNPVLLFLHGGPGMPTYFLSEKYPTGLEKKFTVCYWEQRGAGLSYSPDAINDIISPEIIIDDAIELSKYLCDRFGQKKIYLMGHSWGSFIGIQVAKKAPELYHAYIGVSQVSNQAESEKLALSYMLTCFREEGMEKISASLLKFRTMESDSALVGYFKKPIRDKAMHMLGIGTMHTMRSVISGIFLPVMGCKAYTVREKINIWRAKLYLMNKTSLINQLLTTDLTTEILTIDIPVYFMSGIHDYTVNYSLSKSYMNALSAPVKGFYSFRNSAHSPMHEEPEKFLRIMVEDVLSGSTVYSDIEKLASIGNSNL